MMIISYHYSDIWIAAVGDSFASGEGNPDIERGLNNSAEWISCE